MLFAFATVGLMVASAAGSYQVTLYAPGVVNGSELKAGEYKLQVEGDKAILRQGKVKTEANVKVEDLDKKVSSTTVKYVNGQIAEIRLGGTKTKLVFAGTPSEQAAPVGN
ncbi:MAG: hypothetical protein C5B47_08240 [Verrucomicrobia bacterium]|nr:MAG: hypothetical protein C5B47_08240 [Verrucomicrobiota bacterium]